MLNGAVKIISEYINAGDKIALGVSGGIDSMVLADMVLRDCGIEKSRVLIVNVNHKIRGMSSDNDSLFVERFCAQNNLEFHGAIVDVPAVAAATRRNIEQAAREARLGVFMGLVESSAVKYVLTAHHAEDNAETVLLNLLRGCGMNGLKGMEILSRGGLLRPLLTTQKSEIEEYARLNKIAFVTDETNFDSAYSRNFIRNELMPQIKARWPGFGIRLLKLSDEAKETAAFLDLMTDPALVKVIDGESVLLSGAAFEKGTFLAGRAVVAALKSIGAERDAERKHIESVVNLMSLNNGAELNLSNGLFAVKRYDGVLITKRAPGGASDTEAPFCIGTTNLDGIEISVQQADAPERIDLRKSEGGVLKCDMKKIPEDAVWRFKRGGDIFTSFGGGTKKLKEYLIDKKIPRRERDSVPVLADGATILALAGIEISEHIKVDSGTKDILTIQMKETC